VSASGGASTGGKSSTGAAPGTGGGAGAPDNLGGSAGSGDDGIGIEGGVVFSKDGRARLTVPPGAVEAPLVFSIEAALDKPAVEVASAAYSFTPKGQSFLLDAEICLVPDDGKKTAESCLGYFDEKANDWKCEDTCLSEKDKMLCGSTSHFTNFAILLSGGQGENGSCGDALVPLSGGGVISPDGLAELIVPAGALEKPTRITVSEPDASSAEVVSKIYDFSPDGLKFAGEATLCIQPSAGASTDTSCLGYLNMDGKWQCEDTCLAPKGDQLCGSTSHFTSFAILLSGGKGASCD
jgi:hypothetical protein